MRTRAIILTGAFLGILVGQALPQTGSGSSVEAVAQTKEFAQQTKGLLAGLKELRDQIEHAATNIGAKANAPEIARQTIEEMRAVVSPLLAAVADNGEITKLGALALKNAVDRKAATERDQRFASEERQMLVELWAKRIEATRSAVGELEQARETFLHLLTVLQSKEDLIGELAALEAQDEVIAAINQLTKALKDTSVDVQNMIAWLESPGS